MAAVYKISCRIASKAFLANDVSLVYILLTLALVDISIVKNVKNSLSQIPSQQFFKVSNRNTRKKCENMFKVNNKDTSMTPF